MRKPQALLMMALMIVSILPSPAAAQEAATCSDLIKNQDETDVDCGGVCSAEGKNCANYKACSIAADCQSNTCENGKCLPGVCADKLRGIDESDIDCGGICPPCPSGKKCRISSDCDSKLCSEGFCAVRNVCGNGLIESNEQCDGLNLGGRTCASITGNPKSTGILRCSKCTFDASQCTKPCVNPPPGWVAWFTGDGNTFDLAGGYPAKRLKGTSYLPARAGRGFIFVDDSAGLLIPHDPRFDLRLPGWSVEFWMLGNKDQPSQVSTLIEKLPQASPPASSETGGQTAQSPIPIGWSVSVTDTGQISFKAGDSSAYTAVSSELDTLDGKYHHVLAEWGGAKVTLLIDGVQQASTDLSSPQNSPDSMTVAFSNVTRSSTQQFRGLIDEIRFFNRALTPTEVTAIVQAQGQNCKPKGPSCDNKILDRGESDVDCGGPCIDFGLKCPKDKKCNDDADCATSSCQAAVQSIAGFSPGTASTTVKTCQFDFSKGLVRQYNLLGTGADSTGRFNLLPDPAFPAKILGFQTSIYVPGSGTVAAKIPIPGIDITARTSADCGAVDIPKSSPVTIMANLNFREPVSAIPPGETSIGDQYSIVLGNNEKDAIMIGRQKETGKIFFVQDGIKHTGPYVYPNEWHNIAIVYDTDPYYVLIYVDGRPDKIPPSQAEYKKYLHDSGFDYALATFRCEVYNAERAAGITYAIGSGASIPVCPPPNPVSIKDEVRDYAEFSAYVGYFPPPPPESMFIPFQTEQPQSALDPGSASCSFGIKSTSLAEKASMDGRINKVWIWNRALSYEEIWELNRRIPPSKGDGGKDGQERPECPPSIIKACQLQQGSADPCCGSGEPPGEEAPTDPQQTPPSEPLDKCGDGQCGQFEICEQDECCSGMNVDLLQDPDNCGKCDNKCPGGSQCKDGLCQFPPPGAPEQPPVEQLQPPPDVPEGPSGSVEPSPPPTAPVMPPAEPPYCEKLGPYAKGYSWPSAEKCMVAASEMHPDCKIWDQYVSPLCKLNRPCPLESCSGACPYGGNKIDCSPVSYIGPAHDQDTVSITECSGGGMMKVYCGKDYCKQSPSGGWIWGKYKSETDCEGPKGGCFVEEEECADSIIIQKRCLDKTFLETTESKLLTCTPGGGCIYEDGQNRKKRMCLNGCKNDECVGQTSTELPPCEDKNKNGVLECGPKCICPEDTQKECVLPGTDPTNEKNAVICKTPTCEECKDPDKFRKFLGKPRAELEQELEDIEKSIKEEIDPEKRKELEEKRDRIKEKMKDNDRAKELLDEIMKNPEFKGPIADGISRVLSQQGEIDQLEAKAAKYKDALAKDPHNIALKSQLSNTLSELDQARMGMIHAIKEVQSMLPVGVDNLPLNLALERYSVDTKLAFLNDIETYGLAYFDISNEKWSAITKGFAGLTYSPRFLEEPELALSSVQEVRNSYISQRNTLNTALNLLSSGKVSTEDIMNGISIARAQEIAPAGYNPNEVRNLMHTVNSAKDAITKGQDAFDIITQRDSEGKMVIDNDYFLRKEAEASETGKEVGRFSATLVAAGAAGYAAKGAVWAAGSIPGYASLTAEALSQTGLAAAAGLISEGIAFHASQNVVESIFGLKTWDEASQEIMSVKGHTGSILALGVIKMAGSFAESFLHNKVGAFTETVNAQVKAGLISEAQGAAVTTAQKTIWANQFDLAKPFLDGAGFFASGFVMGALDLSATSGIFAKDFSNGILTPEASAFFSMNNLGDLAWNSVRDGLAFSLAGKAQGAISRGLTELTRPKEYTTVAKAQDTKRQSFVEAADRYKSAQEDYISKKEAYDRSPTTENAIARDAAAERAKDSLAEFVTARADMNEATSMFMHAEAEYGVPSKDLLMRSAALEDAQRYKVLAEADKALAQEIRTGRHDPVPAETFRNLYSSRMDTLRSNTKEPPSVASGKDIKNIAETQRRINEVRELEDNAATLRKSLNELLKTPVDSPTYKKLVLDMRAKEVEIRARQSQIEQKLISEQKARGEPVDPVREAAAARRAQEIKNQGEFWDAMSTPKTPEVEQAIDARRRELEATIC